MCGHLVCLYCNIFLLHNIILSYFMLLFVVIKYAVTLYVSNGCRMCRCHPVCNVSVMVTPCMCLVGVTCDVMSDIANSIIGD